MAGAIEAEQLERAFKDVRAVAGIDLHVDNGEIYGFLGPNGAGKSTTVHMLTTLLPPTGGTARVGGFDVRHDGPKVRRVIGAALQEAALDPLLTGREHLRLQMALQNTPRHERKPRGEELLDRVGLTEAGDRKVRTYSGGMKRRLDLALALVHQPRILFLDEPTTGLDPQSRSALCGGGRAARARRGRDRLPHHAVPRRGGRAREPGRDHRQGHDRRGGNPCRAEGDDRPAERRGRAGDPRRRRRRARRPPALRRADRRAPRRGRPPRRRRGAPRPRSSGPWTRRASTSQT